MKILEPGHSLEQARATRNPVKKLYFWTLHWSETKYALPALVVISFAESSFFPVPPDVLLLAMCFAVPRQAFQYAFWCSVASVAGGVLGYYIGMFFWELTRDLFFAYVFSEKKFRIVEAAYQGNAFMAILTAAFTPIPYKVFTIAAGVCQVNLGTLVLASAVGRSARFFMVGGLIFFFGQKVKPFLEKYFEWFTILFVVLAILGVMAIKLVR